MAEKVGFVTQGDASATGDIPEVGVGMLGYAFMGKAHSNAYKKIPYIYWPPPAIPILARIAGRSEEKVAQAARRYGYAAYSTMRPGAEVLTATYTINLLAPAAGDRFAITGQVIRAGRTLAVCRGEAFAEGAAAPFAVMQATMMALYDRPGLSG